MNERIRELAKEAGILPGVMGLNRFTYFDPEKFAELIVKECIEICNNTNNAGYLNGVVASEKIKKHFGVNG